MPDINNRKLILGSTSAYRRELLSRLRVPFSVESPHVDETPLPGEFPAALARRLALAKAQAVAQRFDEIETYLRAEQPYDCAGSAKSEGLGITLLQSIENDDPTALVGLPLIRTSLMLRAAGIALLGAKP